MHADMRAGGHVLILMLVQTPSDPPTCPLPEKLFNKWEIGHTMQSRHYGNRILVPFYQRKTAPCDALQSDPCARLSPGQVKAT